MVKVIILKMISSKLIIVVKIGCFIEMFDSNMMICFFSGLIY